MCSWLTPELKKHVGDFTLFGSKNYSFRVPINPVFLREIANTWRDQLEATGYKTSRSRTIKVSIQMHPDLQKRFATTGKLLDFVKDNCDGAAEAKGYFNPDFAVYVETNDEEVLKSIMVASVSEDGQVVWEEDGLALVSCRSKEDASTKLRQFRRK